MKKVTFLFAFLMGIQLSCNTIKKESEILILKKELIEIAKKQNDDFSFLDKTIQDSKRKVVTLTNSDIGNQVFLNTKDTTLLLGYISEKLVDRKNTQISKYEIIKKDSLLSLIIKDENESVVEKNDYLTQDKILEVPKINNENPFPDCNGFICILEELRCEANRICETIYYHVHCCDDVGCYHISYFFEPDNPFCGIARPIKIDVPVIVAQ